jgi:von Willebrand factor type A domain
MTTEIGSESRGDARSAALRRGRMALEALKSREQAALFHAAHAELQAALLEAESGNDGYLKSWLEEHRSLLNLESVPESLLSKLQSTFEVAEVGVKASIVAAPEIECMPSPWPAMIEGANRRARSRTPYASSKEPELSQNANSMSGLVSNSISGSIETTANKTSPNQELQASESVNYEALNPKALRESLRIEKPTTSSTRKWAWLSSSFLGSIAAHLVALIVASTYMIHLTRSPEPKAIIASAVETETLSMEAPMEMTTSEVPSVDPSESSIPILPSFSNVVSASSSSIQLPSSMTGLITNETPSPAENSIQQAMNSSKSTSAVNSVQFFGVKAAGNTFCYVVDVSPSMKKDNAFAAAKAELVRSLSLLKPKQRFYITFFGGEIERLTLSGRDEEEFPIYATPENLQRTLVWIDRVRVQEKGLPPNNALKEAIKMDPDGIFLLFDGDTTVDVAAYLRKANRSDDIISGDTPSVPIHTIGFYTQEFEALMRRIAIENNGVYRFVPKPAKIK